MIGTTIEDDDLKANEDKTNFHLRIAEIVRQNSHEASMVVMTLPTMKRGGSNPFPPLLYMAWMDFISKQMPPFLLIRGNQESVLTFYS